MIESPKNPIITLAPCKHCGSGDISFCQQTGKQTVQCERCGVCVQRTVCDSGDYPWTAQDAWNSVPRKEYDEERATCEVPLVCDFLRQGLAEEGDVLIDSKGNTDVYLEYRFHKFYPNQSNKETWSKAGWKYVSCQGKRKATHIVRIERDGVVVAAGQRYDD